MKASVSVVVHNGAFANLTINSQCAHFVRFIHLLWKEVSIFRHLIKNISFILTWL